MLYLKTIPPISNKVKLPKFTIRYFMMIPIFSILFSLFFVKYSVGSYEIQ